MTATLFHSQYVQGRNVIFPKILHNWSRDFLCQREAAISWMRKNWHKGHCKQFCMTTHDRYKWGFYTQYYLEHKCDEIYAICCGQGNFWSDGVFSAFSNSKQERAGLVLCEGNPLVRGIPSSTHIHTFIHKAPIMWKAFLSLNTITATCKQFVNSDTIYFIRIRMPSVILWFVVVWYQSILPTSYGVIKLSLLHANDCPMSMKQP